MSLPKSHTGELTSRAAPGAASAAPPPAIVRLPTAVTAFIGRTLKGPLNTPVSIGGFGEFQQVFGGLWQPAPLGYALEHYFENGGRQAIVVRVANSARAPTLRLPAGRGALLLRGRSPGTREFLRAAVDYDGIKAGALDQFNLVLQRLRAPGSQLIEDQETVRGVSVRVSAPNNVEQALSESRLMRVAGPLPMQRPEPTAGLQNGNAVGYIGAQGDGTDGLDLTDYDVIGAEADGTGLFALCAGPRFDLLCVPPLTREQDPGLATLLVAARLCRSRQALLLVDAPRDWDSVKAAATGAERWAFHSEDALMFFPRLLGFDRLRGRQESFAATAAAAGMMARADQSSPLWSAAAGEGALLRPSLRLSLPISAAERAQLARLGVNCVEAVRTPPGMERSAHTLLPENAAREAARLAPARRLSLWLQSCILEGTRWTLEEAAGPELWGRAAEQVAAFLDALSEEGAFTGRDSDERYFVVCDRRLNDQVGSARRFCLLFGFAAFQPNEFQTCLVTHEPGASRVRVVSLNRLALMSAREMDQIETAILRQLVSEPGLERRV